MTCPTLATELRDVAKLLLSLRSASHHTNEKLQRGASVLERIAEQSSENHTLLLLDIRRRVQLIGDKVMLLDPINAAADTIKASLAALVAALPAPGSTPTPDQVAATVTTLNGINQGILDATTALTGAATTPPTA